MQQRSETRWHKPLRECCQQQLKAEISYLDAEQKPSERVIWPLGLVFWGGVWTLTAWCEQRNDFRNFRIDRIQDLRQLEQVFETCEKIQFIGLPGLYEAKIPVQGTLLKHRQNN